jgi:hypothetical protein
MPAPEIIKTWPEMAQFNFAERVLGYYSAIDSFTPPDGNLDKVLEIFHPTTFCYKRGGLPTIYGISELEHFFRHIRDLRGHHHIDRIQEDGLFVWSHGYFVGSNSKGEVNEEFNDYFLFTNHQLPVGQFKVGFRGSIFSPGVQI